MHKIKMMVAGMVLAGVGLSASPAAWGAASAAKASPVQHCVAESWHKVYTRDDADFDTVRAHLEVELARSGETGRLRGLEPRRMPAGLHSFSVTIESRRCEAVPPGPAAWSPQVTGPCSEVGCADPLPGTSARDGSIMVIQSCEGGKRTTAVYERRDGRWVLVEYEQVRSTECGPLMDG